MNPIIIDLLQKENFLKTVTPGEKAYVIYDREWLFEHLEEEFELLKSVKDTASPIKTFTKEDFENWMKESMANKDK